MSYAFWRKLDTLIIIWTYNARESDGKHLLHDYKCLSTPPKNNRSSNSVWYFSGRQKSTGKKGRTVEISMCDLHVYINISYESYTYRYWINQLNQAHVYQDATLLSPAPTHSLSRIKTSRNRGICPVIAVDVGSSQNIFASEVANLLQLML